MSKTALGVFCIALASLLLELNLIRIFDVLWYPNMSYMIITLAVFSFGLAGVYLSLKPINKDKPIWPILSALTIFTSIWVLCMKWAVNKFPFDYNLLAGGQTTEMAINFFAIYVVICVPFFLSGLVLSIVFSHYSAQIRKLYFWDLVGAALGSVLLIPLLPEVGTTGILFIVAGLALTSTLCFSANRNKLLTGVIVAGIITTFAIPFARDDIDTFEPHMNKRAFGSLVQIINEGTWWDPISKINVLNTHSMGDFRKKWIAYDGGTQSSYFYPFDGDFKKLRASLPNQALDHFWNSYVAVSHFLKADTDAEVLIIGSAGGQELKAALTYEAAHVDAIELVGTVIELGKTQYADYTGNLMNDPRANVIKGEGRSFLRSSGKTYDIIQMFSNHTSSSIAAGSGAMQPNYLQTVEAYKEYFTHLSDDGILHINHHIYPKMVATASRAWAELGRTNFRQHVLVSDNGRLADNLPTLLVKMSPWTEKDMLAIKSFMGNFHFPVHPMKSEISFLSDDFFSGKLPQSVIDAAPYRIEEPTDNKPFFNSLRTNLSTLPAYDPAKFVNESISELLNSQNKTGYPTDVIHLFITAGAAIVFAILFTVLPMLFAKTGRDKWQGKASFMTYFCCLGLGFIVFELVFIQIFMKLIGFPLYTYTTVLFTFLFGAGIGSLYSEKLQIMERGKIWLPFLGIALSTLFVVLCKVYLFNSLLELATLARVAASIVIIFPLAFFLGMPFPMGVLAIKDRPHGTIAWAWGLNGLFTVAGGVFCAIFAVYFGFIATMMVALSAYVIAYIAFTKLYEGYTQKMTNYSPPNKQSEAIKTIH